MANLANMNIHVSQNTMNCNLKLSNLPSHYDDQDIIQGLQMLIKNESIVADFKKIIFKRNRTGKVSLFVKFANKHHVCIILFLFFVILFVFFVITYSRSFLTYSLAPCIIKLFVI